MQYISLFFVSILFTGCMQGIILLDSEARYVRIVTNEPDNCEYLGEVYGYQSGSSLNDSKRMQGAINNAKNEAYKIGGDTLYFLSNIQKTSYISNDRGVVVLDSSSVATNETSIVGLVYRCK